MPVHPRTRTVIALTLAMLFAQANVALAVGPIHLTDRESKVAPIYLTRFAQAPIHLTGADA
jgi:hypothetical protein